jgi:argininosuccinate lyase
VATDIRLWLRDELRGIEKLLVDLLQVTAQRAEAEIEYLMPGYTHLQRAQVSSTTWPLAEANSLLTPAPCSPLDGATGS